MSMRPHTAHFWIRAKLVYPLTYTNEWYLDNVKHFRFPQEMNEIRHVRSFQKADEEFGVTLSIYFGYDEIGVSTRKSSEVSDEEEILPKLTQIIADVFGAYKKFKKYFVSEICPKERNGSFEVDGDYVLIDIKEFLRDLSKAQKTRIVKTLLKTLKTYTSEPKLIAFGDELKPLEIERPVKAMTGEEIERAQQLDFESMCVLAEWISIYVYHYGATRPLALDPSHSILDCAEFGFINSLHLMDLHYSLKKLYDEIGKEKEELRSLEKNCLPRGLPEHRRRIVELENKAMIYETALRENVDFTNAIYQGIKEPYDDSFKKKPEYYIKVARVIEWIRSSPNSIFESAGLLEYIELGGMKSITRDVKPLITKISNLEIRLDQNWLYMILGLYGLFLLLLIPSALCYQFNIGDIADLVEISTFAVAILILSIRVWPARR